MEKTYTFQEITKQDELVKLFRLRYQVYGNSDLAPLLKKNEHEMDIDVFDLHSRFFGIWCNNELAAGIRAVVDKRDYYNPLVYEIGHKYNFYNGEADSQEKLVSAGFADFPFLSYASVPVEIKRFYDEQRKDKKVFMSSRCVIDENYRGLKTIQFLTEGIIMIGMLLSGEKAGLAVTDVSILHSKFYDRYGFSPIKNCSEYYIGERPSMTIAMFLSTSLSLSSVPQYFHSKFEEMMLEYSSTHKITRTL
ncbi:MAG: hypothetical protein V1775_03670 [Bacteroidota bacterium]